MSISEDETLGDQYEAAFAEIDPDTGYPPDNDGDPNCRYAGHGWWGICPHCSYSRHTHRARPSGSPPLMP